LLTDRGKKKEKKESYAHHKRTNSTIKKSTNHHNSRHPTPSTGVSTKFNNSNHSHLNNTNFQKIKEPIPHPTYKKLTKDSNKLIGKNISDNTFKMPKKKLILNNNSSLGD
jgi:hypothetical protein